MNLTVNGVPRKVSFLPTLNYLPGENGSKYETRDEAVQEALERRGGFGSIFWIDEDESEQERNDSAERPSMAAGNAESVQPGMAGGATRDLETVKVMSMADAKAWLVDNKGWQPKSRITKRGLIEAAEEYGVNLEIGE